MGEQAEIMLRALELAGGDQDEADAMLEDPFHELWGEPGGLDLDDKYGLFDKAELASEDGAEPLATGEDPLECWLHAIALGRVMISEDNGNLTLRNDTLIEALAAFETKEEAAAPPETSH